MLVKNCPLKIFKILKIAEEKKIQADKAYSRMLLKLFAAALVISLANSRLPTTDPLDPNNRMIVYNHTEYGSTKETPIASPATPKAKTGQVRQGFDKVKFAFEIAGGTLTSVCVIASIIYAIKNGARLEDVLAQHLPLVLQLRNIWRPVPRNQADLIDL